MKGLIAEPHIGMYHAGIAGRVTLAAIRETIIHMLNVGLTNDVREIWKQCALVDIEEALEQIDEATNRFEECHAADLAEHNRRTAEYLRELRESE